jgi:hypothetical protein
MLRVLLPLMLLCIAAMSVYAYGYATEIGFLDCACKWDKNEIVVWIDNTQEQKYSDIVAGAFYAWQTEFPKLHFSIHTERPAKWDIDVRIVDRFLDTENPDVLAKSNINALWSTATIEGVSIVVPTHLAVYESEGVKYRRMNDVMFYNIVLHKAGHSIGLGHAADNEDGMIDPMFKYISKSEGKRVISKLDVMTISRLYR